MYSASWLSRGNLCKNSRVCIRNCIQIMLFLHCVVVIATRSMLVRANLRFDVQKKLNSKTKMNLIFSYYCFILPSSKSPQMLQKYQQGLFFYMISQHFMWGIQIVSSQNPYNFTWKSECGYFKITGIACIHTILINLKSLHSDFTAESL